MSQDRDWRMYWRGGKEEGGRYIRRDKRKDWCKKLGKATLVMGKEPKHLMLNVKMEYKSSFVKGLWKLKLVRDKEFRARLLNFYQNYCLEDQGFRGDTGQNNDSRCSCQCSPLHLHGDFPLLQMLQPTRQNLLALPGNLYLIKAKHPDPVLSPKSILCLLKFEHSWTRIDEMNTWEINLENVHAPFKWRGNTKGVCRVRNT